MKVRTDFFEKIALFLRLSFGEQKSGGFSLFTNAMAGSNRLRKRMKQNAARIIPIVIFMAQPCGRRVHPKPVRQLPSASGKAVECPARFRSANLPEISTATFNPCHSKNMNTPTTPTLDLESLRKAIQEFQPNPRRIYFNSWK